MKLVNIFTFIFLLMGACLYATTKSEQIAQDVVKWSNIGNTSFSSDNDIVKTYNSEAIGNMVIHHRQELTKNKNELLVLKSGYIDAYQQVVCSFVKPIIKEGVIIKVNTYEKNGNLAFDFIVKCK